MLKKAVKSKIIKGVLGGMVLLIVITTMVLIASGTLKSKKYLDPWKKDYSNKFKDPRIQLISNGILAANSHNMQPWKIKLDDKNPMIFYLYADDNKLTKEVDPFARQTMISQGTFLTYVKVCGEKHGYATYIELFPNGEYDEENLAKSMREKPVARITLNKTKTENNNLYDHMFLSDTNRDAYKDIKLNDNEINLLKSIGEGGSCQIKIYQDKDNVEKLGEYALQGAKIEAAIPRVSKETSKIFRKNEYEKNKIPIGFSLDGQGVTGTKKEVMQALITIIPSLNNEKSSGESFIKSTKNSIDHTQTYVMMITKGNSRKEQVISGMYYSELILKAHSFGIVMQPVSQVLEEYPEMKEAYNKIHSEYVEKGNIIQMLMRVGKPTKEFPLTMRQDVMEFISE